MEITFDRKSVNTCLQQRFTLPSYQREYRWETKHLQDLLTDIQEEFLNNYKPDHGRSKVGEYAPYFLGTIITTPAGSGARSVVDGQQRLTTLSLILAYFHRMAKANPDQEISDVEPLIRRKVFGASEFNLEFDPDRKSLMEMILDRLDLQGDDLDEAAETVSGVSIGTREVYKIFTNVDNFILDEIKQGLVARFVDYITERVYLFEIGVPSEQDGHKVFVTMNDRGLRLAPIDLLKGYLLSNVSDQKANGEANHKWAESIKKLRSLGRDEDSAFFRTWLRAQYADTARGKSRGDAPADFEIVGDAYHRWVVDNDTAMGLNNSDDYQDLVGRKIPFYVEQYLRIRDAEKNYTTEFPHVYYNGARSLALQYMAILAALDINDTAPVIDKKIRVVSFYLDALLTSRMISGKDNNYDNIKDAIFSLTRKIRRKPLSEIVATLKSLMDEVRQGIDKISNIMFFNYKTKDVLHLLARIASYIEDKADITNKVGFAEYIDRSKGTRSFDVEHAVPFPIGVSLGFKADGTEILTDNHTQFYRHRIGGLLLLPRGKNRSMQAMSYPDKLVRYASENVLAQSLVESFYLNNPTVNNYISTSNMPIQAEVAFYEDSFTRRAELYHWVASKIWNEDCFDALAS